MSIITLSYIALALFLGYAVAVALSMAATFGITAVSPGFVSKNNRINPGYKFLQDAVWLVCAVAGGYVAALVNGESHSWLVGSALWSQSKNACRGFTAIADRFRVAIECPIHLYATRRS